MSSTIYNELVTKKIDLKDIYLDPNNPRFTSFNWTEIGDNNIDDENIQEQAMARMMLEFSVEKLMMNIESNGFLTIDRVIVREFKPDKYVVLEGNRRVCAAKKIIEKHAKNSESVTEDVIKSLNLIECLVYTGSEEQPSWIFQGLRHIMGIQDWSAFNKAKLLVKLMEEEELSLTEVGKKFGLTAFGAGQWVRGYYAFKSASEESDYTNEVDEKVYPYLQEIFSRSNAPLRDWLEWDDKDFSFKNGLNFNELLSWLYPRCEGEDTTNQKGDWSNRRVARSSDIRMLSQILRDEPTEFEQFRIDGNLEKAYNIANTKKYIKESDPAKEAFENIESCSKSLENIPYKVLKNEKQKLRAMLMKLNALCNDLISECNG